MANLLYNHSCYSLLESTIRIKDLVGFCAENGYKTVSLCDRNVMYGYKYLTEERKKAALKPLYGLQIEISVDEYTCSYVLYAVNNEGYKLLMRISTYINAGNKLTINDLKLLSDDVVVISIESESGYLERCLRSDREKLEQLLEIYRSIRHFYIGLEAGKSRYIRDLNILLTDFCRSSNLRYVAMPLALWKGREDYESYQIVTAIRNQTTLDDQNLRFRSECHLRTQEELFNDFDSEAIGNTNVIADMCNVDLDQIPVATLPKFPCPNGASSESYLKSLTVAGLRKRFGSDQIPESYYRRLKYELKVILEMGFADYFLIIWDIILYCHRNNIYVGFGRGSSAGSLVAYCLGITQIDPLKHNLIFERFLNPERITMPDIDIDFPDDRRQEVIEYISRQYGQDRVAHIITFTTFGCRQALIDSCKVHSLSESKTKLLIKSLSRGSDITIAEEMQKNNQFRRAVKSDPEYDKIVSGAIKIEGLPRQTSMHAAGIVISNDRLIAHIPLIRNDEQGNLTQYTMEFLENMGLIKIDILGLSNLAVTSRIIEEVRKDCGITSYRFPLDDEKTYRLFAGGDTSGIFQFESEGIRKLLRNMRPACFEDLCIAIALYRPGPMDNIPLYLENRKHPERITYVNERIREILAPTSGIMIYQEQIMKITQIVAGFSLGKADILRKAVSKKNEEQMQSLREEFLEGAVNNGYRIDEARSIFDQIERFANYGFNKAHSVVYASLSYQQAYLKANYPLQFYQQMLNSVSGNLKKTSEYILECRRKGIDILPPDINRSALEYVREGNNIRYPLSGIKDISRT